MTAALDALDAGDPLASAAKPPTAERVAKEIDGRDAKDVLAARSVRWACVISYEVQGKPREALESALDAAHYVMNLSQADLYRALIKKQEEVAQRLGADVFDEQVSVKAAMEFTREINRKLLAVDPFAGLPSAEIMRIGKISGALRCIGYSTAAIASITTTCVIECEGDKKKAVSLLQHRYNEQSQSFDRGFRGSFSYVDEKGVPLTEEPAMQPYTPEQPVAIATAQYDDAGEPVLEYMPAGALVQELAGAEAKEQELARQERFIDELAALKLKDRHYVVYRVLRERTDVPGEIIEKNVARSLIEQVGFATTQSANASVQAVRTLIVKFAEGVDKDVMPLDTADNAARKKAVERMGKPAAEIIAAEGLVLREAIADRSAAAKRGMNNGPQL